MKTLYFITLLSVFNLCLNAQQKASKTYSNVFSIGAEEGLPLGAFRVGYSFGTGGSVQIQHRTSSTLAFTLNAGYIHYFLHSNLVFQSPEPGLGLFPVLAGAKIYMSPGVYGHAQFGVAFSSRTGAGTYIAYSPGVGFEFAKVFDALIKFEGFSKKYYSKNSIGLWIAYKFHQ